MQIKKEEITNISERINFIIENQGDTKNSFALKLGYPRSQTLYDIVNGKSLPSYDFFHRFATSEYSEIYRLDWLITGNGEKFKRKPYTEQTNVLSTQDPASAFFARGDQQEDDQKIPLYNIEATAGLNDLFDHKQQTALFISIPNLPKCDGAIYVTGDSMYPLLKTGDIVLYKQVNDIENGIFWGEMYLLTFEIGSDSYTMVKWLQRSEHGAKHVKLVSQNQQHEPRDIPLNAIKALAHVKASIRSNSMT